MAAGKPEAEPDMTGRISKLAAFGPENDDDMIPACKENLWEVNTEVYHQSPFLERTRAGNASRRVSKAESVSSLFADPAMELPGPPDAQVYIRERFTMLENRLEDYLDSVTEDISQDLEREQQHLILMQQQVDKQGQMLHRELIAMHKKLDGETTRRSFVSNEVRGTKEALAEQLEQQGKELAALRARLADLETPPLVRSLRRILAGWLAGCSPWTRDLLPPVPPAGSESLPLHQGELTPLTPHLPAKMDA